VPHPSPGRFIVAARDGPGTLSKSLSIIELSDERRQLLRMTRARRYCKRAFTPRGGGAAAAAAGAGDSRP